MKVILLKTKIEAISQTEILCRLTEDKMHISLSYFPLENRFVFDDENELTAKVKNFLFQFEKILRSAIKGKIELGQEINCVFIDGFSFIKDADYGRIIRMDRRNGELKIGVVDSPTKAIYKIYADGSFADKIQQSGYGGIIETPDGKQEIYHRSIKNGSSNLIELLAVTEGLERLKEEEIIQINTDSRFVIRGLVQWVHFWRHNGWQTAFGTKVKFAESWQYIDQLCEGKLIEFRWIKGHSGHLEQEFCDRLAGEVARDERKTGV